MNGHTWSSPDADGVTNCTNGRCTVRRHMESANWQPRKGGHWRSRSPLPDCKYEGQPREAPTMTALYSSAGPVLDRLNAQAASGSTDEYSSEDARALLEEMKARWNAALEKAAGSIELSGAECSDASKRRLARTIRDMKQ